MKKKFSLLFVTIIIFNTVFATPISSRQARQAAFNFAHSMGWNIPYESLLSDVSQTVDFPGLYFFPSLEKRGLLSYQLTIAQLRC